MYTPPNSGASAYAKVGMESNVIGASSHELITLLFQGARRAISLARIHMQRKDYPAKGKAVGHAINIIGGGLQQALNLEKGGDLAARLNALYGYMTRRLLEASLKNDEGMLTEVDGLLATIEDGWVAIGNNPVAPGANLGSGATQQKSASVTA
jgi:flagellar secretion chaperone FliS